MSPRPGVALAGCGRIARLFHLPLLQTSSAAELVAVADADPQARQAAAATAGHVAAVEDWQDLLGMPQVRAVVVALPTGLHAEVATAALRAGKHVYVEKPLAHDLGAARAVLEAWEPSGLVGTVGFNFRWHPLVRAARSQVRRGRLGSLVAVRGSFCSAPRELPAWKRSRATGGGALLDLASHHVDLLRHLLDTEVEAVSAVVRSVRTEADTAAMTCRLRSGAVAQLLASSTAADTDRLELMGDAGTLLLDRVRRRRLEWTPSARPVTRSERLREAGRQLGEGARGTADRLRPPREPSFGTALGAFLAAVTGAAPDGAPTILDGYRSLEVIDAAERSAASGAEVAVAGEDGPGA